MYPVCYANWLTEYYFSLGYAFHIGTVLTKREIESLYDKITGVISQADEIDGQYYQFDSGLTLTCELIY